MPRPLSQNLLFRLIPFFFLFLIYGIFTYPCLYWGDSAEFSYVATFLGIPHPTGYPLYTQLLRLFSSIPLGSPYFLHNLFSAFWAALSIAVLFHICLRFTENATASWIASFFFALSPTFLTRAALAEVYTMQVFIVLILTLLGLSLLQEWDVRKCWGISFLLGLGLSHHLITVMALPAILFLLTVSPKGSKNFRLFLGAGLFGLIGLLPYLFIAFRAHVAPEFSYPNYFGITMYSWKDWYWLMSGEIFRTEMSSFSLKKHIDDFGFFFFLLFKDFYWVGGIIGLLGLVKEFRNHTRYFIFLALLFFVQSAALIHYNVPDVFEFYIMAFSLWTPFLAMGLYQVGLLLGKMLPKRKLLLNYLAPLSWVLLLIPIAGIIRLYKPVSLEQTSLAYVHRVFSFPQHGFSLFTTYQGRDVFRLFQFLTPVRPDISVIDYGLDLLKERSRLLKAEDSFSDTFGKRFHRQSTQIMEKKLIEVLKHSPVYFSRNEWFLPDKFVQRKIFDSFNSVTLKEPPTVITSLPEGVHPANLLFGSVLHLLGYSISPSPVIEGELLTLHLYWRKAGNIPSEVAALIVFQNKEYPHSSSALGQFFSELTLGYGLWPPSNWPEGKIIEEVYQITPPTILPGVYAMALGLYDKNWYDTTPPTKIPRPSQIIGEINIVPNPGLRHYWEKN